MSAGGAQVLEILRQLRYEHEVAEMIELLASRVSDPVNLTMLLQVRHVRAPKHTTSPCCRKPPLSRPLAHT